MAKQGDLRVWWVPQVPMKPFIVQVKSLEQAALILDTLARYDWFQYEENVKPDFANAGGLHVYNQELYDYLVKRGDDPGDGWYDWEDEFGDGFDQWMEDREVSA